MKWLESEPVGRPEETQGNFSERYIKPSRYSGGSFLWRIWHRKGSPSRATL